MNTLTDFSPIVNPVTPLARSFALHRSCYSLPSHDEPRPTAGPDFEPTPEDAAEWATLANDDGRDEIMTEWANDDRAERMAQAFSDPWDLMSDGELVECGGYHPAHRFEV